MTQAEFRFELDNNVELVPPLIEHLGGNMSRMQYRDRMDLMRVGIEIGKQITMTKRRRR